MLLLLLWFCSVIWSDTVTPLTVIFALLWLFLGFCDFYANFWIVIFIYVENGTGIFIWITMNLQSAFGRQSFPHYVFQLVCMEGYLLVYTSVFLNLFPQYFHHRGLSWPWLDLFSDYLFIYCLFLWLLRTGFSDFFFSLSLACRILLCLFCILLLHRTCY